MDVETQRQTDDKGRAHPITMSDRHLLEEILNNQRVMMDTVQSFMDSLSTNPMFKMMGAKFLGGK